VQRCGTYLVGRIHCRTGCSIHHDSEQFERQSGRLGRSRNAKLLCFGVPRRICVRGAQIHTRSELRWWRLLERSNKRYPGKLFDARDQYCPPTEYDESAGLRRGPTDAKSPVSKEGLYRVVVGRAQRTELTWLDGSTAVGRDRCHQRCDLDDASATANLRAGYVALSLDGKSRPR